jgi:hypothetical protein
MISATTSSVAIGSTSPLSGLRTWRWCPPRSARWSSASSPGTILRTASSSSWRTCGPVSARPPVHQLPLLGVAGLASAGPPGWPGPPVRHSEPLTCPGRGCRWRLGAAGPALGLILCGITYGASLATLGFPAIRLFCTRGGVGQWGWSTGYFLRISFDWPDAWRADDSRGGTVAI